jgi:GT2 family glycosyltransferase
MRPTRASAPPPARRRWPSVSVVVVNFNGRGYLEDCLRSLRELDYPPEQVEVVFIDNASTDGSVELVRGSFPEVRVLVNDTNTGFSPAVNQGARVAGGEYLALINNDAEADRAWLREAVRVLEAERTVACVACKILRADRRTVDFAGGQMGFYGHGFAKDVEHSESAGGALRRTLFASGGAMVTRTALFLETGGFDETYFAFFEDVDFGWRLWVLGHEVVYVPDSKVFHRHHGTIERFGYARERYLLERNALATIFKNYEDDRLARTLPASLVLTIARGMDVDGLELPDFRITADAEPVDDLKVPALTAAHLAAVWDWAGMLGDLRVKRDIVQAQRRTSDRTIAKLFEDSLRPNVHRPDFLAVFDKVVQAFGLDDHARPRSTVLVITGERIGDRMSGGGIRCWELVNVLAHEHEVTLASTRPVERSHPAFRTVRLHEGNIDELLGTHEVAICHGVVMDRFPQIAEADLPLVVDVSDPRHLQALAEGRAEPGAQRTVEARAMMAALNRQLERADFVICADEAQRDFWLGQLTAIGRVNPATFDQDDTLRALVDTAPVGMPHEPPAAESPAARGVIGGIEPDDFLILCSGALHESLDPATLVRAVAQLAGDHDDVRLLFLGAGGSDPDAPPSRAAVDTRRLAADLGVLGSSVFLHDEGVAYDARAGYLLEADVGVSTHGERVETALSPRHRVLDYLWAGLPVVVTSGNAAARLVTDAQVGLVVPAGDVDALAGALRRLRDDPDLAAACRANAAGLADDWSWHRTLGPVLDFCRRPRKAADHVGRQARYVASRGTVLTRSPVYYLRRFVEYVRTVGPGTALLHVRNFVRSRLA